MKRYSNDPRIIQIRYSTRCKICSCILHKAEQAVYWPATKSLACMRCGGQDYLDFLSSAFDEEVYHGRGNPFCYKS